MVADVVAVVSQGLKIDLEESIERTLNLESGLQLCV